MGFNSDSVINDENTVRNNELEHFINEIEWNKWMCENDESARIEAMNVLSRAWAYLSFDLCNVLISKWWFSRNQGAPIHLTGGRHLGFLCGKIKFLKFQIIHYRTFINFFLPYQPKIIQHNQLILEKH